MQQVTTEATVGRAVIERAISAAPEGQSDIEHFTGGVVDRNAEACGGIAVERLRSLVDRIERLNVEKTALASDIKDVYAEAKGAGFDPKVLRELIAKRQLEKAEVEEHETLLDVYRRALGI